MLDKKPNRHRNLGAEPVAEFLGDLELERQSTNAKLRAALAALDSGKSKKASKSDEDIDSLMNGRPAHRIRMAITTPGIARLRREIALGDENDFFRWALTAAEITKNKWYDETGGKFQLYIYFGSTLYSWAKFYTVIIAERRGLFYLLLLSVWLI